MSLEIQASKRVRGIGDESEAAADWLAARYGASGPIIPIDASHFRDILVCLSNKWRLGPKPSVILGDHPLHGAIMLIDDEGEFYYAITR